MISPSRTSLCIWLAFSAVTGNVAIVSGAESSEILMVQSGDHIYRIRYGSDLRMDYTTKAALLADNPGNLTFTATELFPLALKGRQIDKVVASQWIPKDSLILAIRLHDTERGGYAYCWATYLHGRWTSGETLLRSSERELPYEPSDLTGYPKDGDTISMTWLRDYKNKDGSGDGQRLVYINQCPAGNLGPDQEIGEFLRMFGFKSEPIDVGKSPADHAGKIR